MERYNKICSGGGSQNSTEGEATSPLLANMEQMGKSLHNHRRSHNSLGLILTISGKLPWLGRLPGDHRGAEKEFHSLFPDRNKRHHQLAAHPCFFWFVGRNNDDKTKSWSEIVDSIRHVVRVHQLFWGRLPADRCFCRNIRYVFC